MSDPVALVHNSPLGKLEIPGVGDVEPLEPFTVSPERAEVLLRQHELFRSAVTPYDDLKLEDLKKLATDRGIDVDSRAKADYINAIAFSDQVPVVVSIDEPADDTEPEGDPE